MDIMKINHLRKFRNNLVHNNKEINSFDIEKSITELINILSRFDIE